jgi:hypothetical protein
LVSATVDGNGIGTPTSYSLSNVQADHALAANYAPLLAASNTPEWWLYQYNTNWATNFNAAALSDPTGKGAAVWQDYIAGTNPTNAASVFALDAGLTNGQTVVSFPTIATTAPDQSQRYYALQSSTNLRQPWQGIPGWTNILGLGQIQSYTNPVGAPNSFFRGRVWLGP